MSNYMIHTCTDRRWYVDKYLVPSLLKQGIQKDNIEVYEDVQKDGHLTSFLKSLENLDVDGTWHLQDDIIIASNFKEQTERYDEGVVCGFCNNYSECRYSTGYVTVYQMWYSMPCIRIPDDVAQEFVAWLHLPDVKKTYKSYIEKNKYSDVLFQKFMVSKYSGELVLNLAPNLVNHIDHLIGGSLVNSSRQQSTEYIMSMYWNEPELIDEIANKLQYLVG